MWASRTDQGVFNVSVSNEDGGTAKNRQMSGTKRKGVKDHNRVVVDHTVLIRGALRWRANMKLIENGEDPCGTNKNGKNSRVEEKRGSALVKKTSGEL